MKQDQEISHNLKKWEIEFRADGKEIICCYSYNNFPYLFMKTYTLASHLSHLPETVLMRDNSIQVCFKEN